VDHRYGSPATVFFFFSLYIVLTAWVIMSLFIGCIAMGMFDAFESMKDEIKDERYKKKLKENDRAIDDPTGGALGKLIRDAMADDEDDLATPTYWEQKAADWWAGCKRVRDTSWFSLLITGTIMVVGVMIGIETDQTLSCNRFFARENRPSSDPRCQVTLASHVITYASQAIFTFEVIVKVGAEGRTPVRYFDDGWNCMDSFIVVTGFIMMSPAAFIFENFPVVILRLLRLLRVFRLAKALPRLRSIVEALMHGFSAVGWICILIVVFNYIIACMCMLFMKTNDPFLFGHLPRAMFNVLRIETKDTWDAVL
jgi:hypothetical protein